MVTKIEQGDVVVIKEQYISEVSILPNTKMVVEKILENGNLKTVWMDNAATRYSGSFSSYLIRKSV